MKTFTVSVQGVNSFKTYQLQAESLVDAYAQATKKLTNANDTVTVVESRKEREIS